MKKVAATTSAVTLESGIASGHLSTIVKPIGKPIDYS